jgi:hypothetical protein
MKVPAFRNEVALSRIQSGAERSGSGCDFVSATGSEESATAAAIRSGFLAKRRLFKAQ